MLTKRLINQLEKIVGSSHVSTSGADAELYSYDASLAKGIPHVVVFPKNTDEVSQIIQAAIAENVAFVPRGFGTNLSGGTVLPEGGMVIALSRMNKIIGIYPQRRCAVVQPAVTNLELQNALQPHGFFYAPDPASQKVATIGGNIGENSGGPRCLKYGVTTNHILGLKAVLPDGQIMKFAGPALDPPGYDLRGVLIGSEGTLAIVTEVTVRILPKPESVITMLAIYNDVGDAARSVTDIISAGMVPATLEMMDSPIINAVEDSFACGYPRDAAAVLIIEVEGPVAGLKDQAEKIKQLCTANDCRQIREAKDNDERNRLWEGRRGAFGAVARLAPNYLVNDCSVPRTKLPEALARVAEITKKYGFEHGNVFHAGDGNLHPLIFFDSRDPDQLKRVKQAGWEIMQECVDLGGTITGEHGVGIEKMEAMRMIFSEQDLAFQRGLKHAFDPQNLLNPGKVIPESLKEKSQDITDMPETSYRKATEECFLSAEQQIITQIKDAISSREGLLPIGRGLHWDFGNRTLKPLQDLDSRDLSDIIEYDPGNQVVTAGSGMPLTVLQEHLSAHNQWLPIRAPFALQRHSLGGLIALASVGPERLFYGAPRDLLLGIRFISGLGRCIFAGGRVVKNVAGYDISRLMVGSAGTLGFITQVTLRVTMIPERTKNVCVYGTLDHCIAAAYKIFTSRLLPAYIVILPDNTTHKGTKWRLNVGFEGFKKTVEDQCQKAEQLFYASDLVDVAISKYGVHQGMFHKDFLKFDSLPYIVRCDFPSDNMRSVLKEINGRWFNESLFVDLGCGRIIFGLDTLEPSEWLEVCRLADDNEGHAMLERAPQAFKKANEVFGLSRPEWKIMHRIKSALDPHNVFTPGRMPGKI